MMLSLTKTAKNVESIRRYLKNKFIRRTISEAKRFAFFDDEISFGFLIKVEDEGSIHSVLAVNEFLEETPVTDIYRILEDNDVAEMLKKAQGKFVRLKLSGFDFWEPLFSRNSN